MLEYQVESRKIEPLSFREGAYQRGYKDTNENIDGYMRLLNFEGKTNALTVLASGDHVFNLLYYGILNIDTFDTNKLTEYYAFGIKKSAILAFNYKQYLQFMRRMIDPALTLEELSYWMKQLFPYMEERERIFWTQIIEYNNQLQKNQLKILNLFRMLLINFQEESLVIAKNSYLKNERNYHQTKENLKKATITFQNTNCLDLKEKNTSQYDFLFLSNIADYLSHFYGNGWGYEYLQELEKSLESLINKDGVMALAYLIKYKSLGKNKTYPILCSQIRKEDLTDEEVLLFPHIEKKLLKTAQDGLILKRV